jgi:hypothetical protein
LQIAHLFYGLFAFLVAAVVLIVLAAEVRHKEPGPRQKAGFVALIAAAIAATPLLWELSRQPRPDPVVLGLVFAAGFCAVVVLIWAAVLLTRALVQR